jgi:hypothetical protein
MKGSGCRNRYGWFFNYRRIHRQWRWTLATFADRAVVTTRDDDTFAVGFPFVFRAAAQTPGTVNL